MQTLFPSRHSFEPLEEGDRRIEVGDIMEQLTPSSAASVLAPIGNNVGNVDTFSDALVLHVSSHSLAHKLTFGKFSFALGIAMETMSNSDSTPVDGNPSRSECLKVIRIRKL